MKFIGTVISIFILILCDSICFSQIEKRDSLLRILSSLRDSVRVDCLNRISEVYSSSNFWSKDFEKRDSILYFAGLAYNDAKKLNYVYGIAESLTHKAEAAGMDDSFPTMERFSREAINWYRKTSNKKGLAFSYYILGYSLYAQSYHDQAIKYADSAFYLFKKDEDIVGMYRSIGLSALIYQEKGDYEKYFALIRKSLEMAKRNNDDVFCRYGLIGIGDLYNYFGDNTRALEYYHQAYRNLNPITVREKLGSGAFVYIAELFTEIKQYDSASYYYNFMDTSEPRGRRFYLVSYGRFLYSQGQYEKALFNFLRGLQYNRELNDRNQVMSSLNETAKTYLVMGKTDLALKYANECLSLAVHTGAAEPEKNAYYIISSVFEQRQQYDSAYLYFRKYTYLKEEIFNNKLRGTLSAYKYEQQFASLNRERENQKTELKNKSILEKILIGSLCLLLILSFIIFRNIILKRRNEAHLRELAENELQIQRLEGEKTKAELQQQTSELEMQALRAQMNPHFVFNSLNSINRFILQNNQQQASEFLTKFSRLIRLILQNSQTPLITLESELESLSLYLDLESLRFDYCFSYKIVVSPDLDISELKVPPLIIQPYVENAIWHGLRHKKEKGQLDIIITEENECIYIRISDNGIGREKAAEMASKSATRYKSMGIRITADRISLLQHSYGKEPKVTINDLVYDDGCIAGTEVIIKIPVIYD